MKELVELLIGALVGRSTGWEIRRSNGSGTVTIGKTDIGCSARGSPVRPAG